MTNHKKENCPVCIAIGVARDMVSKTRKQDDAIPVILKAVGWENSPRPWPAAVKALKEHAKSMVLSPKVVAQAKLLTEMEAKLEELKAHLACYEPNSKYFKEKQDVLVHNQGVFDKQLAKLAELKENAGIQSTIAEAEKAIETQGLMDLLGMKASDLTATKRLERREKTMKRPVAQESCTAMDIVAEYHLTVAEHRLADFIAYLRNLMRPRTFRVKRHSKPRKRTAVDENAIKERLAFSRPCVIKEYASGKIIVLR